ncbi:hypothetical protein [Microbacterium enclense]|uniref:Uncharacterized protein n=1 Tax=Microbacterium enclense TaxID=993073 RepID=A0A1G6GNW1_9MICO|nr:hypothetical protein [Microbacterium enclense]KSU56342.1 hypothetical protein AS029_00855 [Microbacterium enclense]SDB82876.1 hypothetical protein SAMN05216418_0407 [Microbacterium enclense]
MSHAIHRLCLSVADATYPLAPTEHVDELKAAIRGAVRSGGDFVDVTLDSGCHLSFFATITSVITITVETVGLDTGTADGEGAADDWAPASFGTYDSDTPWDVI